MEWRLMGGYMWPEGRWSGRCGFEEMIRVAPTLIKQREPRRNLPGTKPPAPPTHKSDDLTQRVRFMDLDHLLLPRSLRW